MEDISRAGMLHYLNEDKAGLCLELHQVTNDKPFRVEFKKEVIVELKSAISLLDQIIDAVIKDKINQKYDNYCIKNGLSRKGTRILV